MITQRNFIIQFRTRVLSSATLRFCSLSFSVSFLRPHHEARSFCLHWMRENQKDKENNGISRNNKYWKYNKHKVAFGYILAKLRQKQVFTINIGFLFWTEPFRESSRELIKGKKVKSSRREYLNGRLSCELSSHGEREWRSRRMKSLVSITNEMKDEDAKHSLYQLDFSVRAKPRYREPKVCNKKLNAFFIRKSEYNSSQSKLRCTPRALSMRED